MCIRNNIDLVFINAYTKFYQNSSICSEDIDEKHTFTSANNVLSLLTFARLLSRIALTLNVRVPPPGCYKTSIRYDLNVNIRKTSPVRCLMIKDI